MIPRWGYLAIILVSLLNSIEWASSVSVMSVDFGSEWMKVAIVSPGVPMEIALNKESKRKTPAFISFRDGERTFGEDAQNVAVKFPGKGYGYLLDLLGKSIDHPLVKLYQQRFPWYNIVADPERNTVVFQHDSEIQYTPEELIGQLLHKAKEFAEESAGQSISDAVLVVPGFFNQVERQAMLNAGKLAGLKVLQLMNDYTAVALNYGIFRRKDFNETTQYIMFYDMGASSTSATLVSYQVVKIKDRGVVETNPQATILGVGYDRTLGGLDIQLRLQKFLAEKFNAVKKTKTDVFSNARAMAKLFKEAGRLKNVLSANVDHYAQVEGLLDEEDFKAKVTREELENLCPDIFARVEGPIKKALENAGLTMDIVSQVILVGAGTRVPMVQETLAKVVKQELGKNINTDEAAVMGAAYKAADISTGFKVKKFITKDAVIFPIQVSYERETETGEIKQQKRTLFGPMNAYPQKKMITFNKNTKDFGFSVHYGELDHLPKEEIDALGPKEIMQVTLTGVAEAINKYSGPGNEPKGIKAHFAMDESGLLALSNVDYIVETINGEEPSTLQKIGSGISKLFGVSWQLSHSFDKDEEVNEVDHTGAKKPADDTQESNPETDNSAETEEKKENEAEKESNDAANATEGKPQEPVEGKPATNETEKDSKPKVVVVKEEIQRQIVELGVKPLSPAQLEASQKKIDDLNDFDAKKQRKEQARNQLESFVFDMQNKLELDQYQKAATEDEKNSISAACTEISGWLDEEGFDADAQTYEEKFSQLKSLTGPLKRRVKEHEDRPDAVKVLNDKLDAATSFAKTIREKTQTALDAGDETIFTTVEIDVLEKLITESKDWLKKTQAQQKTLALSVTPVLTVRSIVEKLTALDREVNYLMNKVKIWRPTKKPTETKADEKKVNGTEKDTKNSSSSEIPPEKVQPEEIVLQEEKPVLEETQTSSDTTDEVKDPPENHQEL